MTMMMKITRKILTITIITLSCTGESQASSSDSTKNILSSSSRHVRHKQYMEATRDERRQMREYFSTVNSTNEESFKKRRRRKEYRDKDGMLRRRDPDAPLIDYGGNHPYERLERQRKRKLKYDAFWYEEKFSLNDYLKPEWYEKENKNKKEEHHFDWEGFRPIRIHVDTSNFPQEQKYEAHNEFMMYYVLPAAVQFWTKALMVYPAERLHIQTSHCSYADAADAYYGLENVDLVIYAMAQVYCSDDDQPNVGDSDVGQTFETVSAADSCDWDQYDKPIAGIVNFCYSQIPVKKDGSAASDEVLAYIIETAIHEIGHVLGLMSKDMAFYYDRRTGLPRTPRKEAKPLHNSFECISGKKAGQYLHDIYLPNSNTLKEGRTNTGIRYFQVVTPTVRQVARNHFNCPIMEGMRLENQPTNDDCFGEHWEERLAWNELMSGMQNSLSIPEVLSPFTLALLEDSGWYRANYSMGQISPFGHGAGCNFVEQPCLLKNKNGGTIVPSYSKGYFCNTVDQSSTFSCDPTHSIIATCDLYDLSQLSAFKKQSVPSKFQYFSNPVSVRSQLASKISFNRLPHFSWSFFVFFFP